MNLLEKAKTLGIQNAESLTPKQLEKAIAAEEKKQAAEALVFEKAKLLGLEIEGKTAAELEQTILEAEQLAAEIAKQARDAELLALLSEYLGISDIDSLSKEEVVALLEQRKKQEVEGIEVVPVIVMEGKTDKAIIASNGLEYVFKDDAPAAFRYLGQHRTQEQWIEDVDAIDLMVAGKLSFLTLKK